MYNYVSIALASAAHEPKQNVVMSRFWTPEKHQTQVQLGRRNTMKDGEQENVVSRILASKLLVNKCWPEKGGLDHLQPLLPGFAPTLPSNVTLTALRRDKKHAHIEWGSQFSDSVLSIMIQFSLDASTSNIPLTAAACRARLHALSLSDLHCRFIIDSCGTHPLLDLSGHGQKGLFNVRGILCWGF